ncbi:unnamed protein product [Arctogadus glacialis]
MQMYHTDSLVAMGNSLIHGVEGGVQVCSLLLPPPHTPSSQLLRLGLRSKRVPLHGLGASHVSSTLLLSGPSSGKHPQVTAARPACTLDRCSRGDTSAKNSQPTSLHVPANPRGQMERQPGQPGIGVLVVVVMVVVVL